MMEIKQQKNLSFNGVDIFQVSYISKQPYNGTASVNLELNPKVFYPDGKPNEFSIIIEASINCPDYYEITFAASGRFTIDPSLTDPVRKSFINNNAPAILFPYIRAFVSTFTSNLGSSVGAVLIPPHFFKGDLEVIKDTEISD
jgi:preprotein translocase subunit SecB